ncbi:gamma-glutamyltransferase family protein [Roseomonas sp. OT10]|uniref:gamma-glutamyltransferase n=1 Tax=Roseomonas cutis TaxID=2897332 RepID=UPI001E3C54AD|nr:gamma-glutamyltransferase [Roseomonas sp. OT10]UFN49423.1 gamma-glutamyltransferase family protein [Roseomonas sp. OT10]
MASAAQNQAKGRHITGRPLRAAARRPVRHAVLLAALLLPGCSTLDRVGNALGGGSSIPPGQVGYVSGFLGGAVADDPRAALVARDLLSAGGSAADAAAAAGFALSVTLPSRAGLGGGGACLAYDQRRGATEAVLFPAAAPAATAPGADRPAAVPLMARGLFALHARFGRRPFEETIAPAEQLARFGAQISRTLAADLATVGAPLLADPRARAVFGTEATEGGRLLQPDLAVTLSQIRTLGVGDFHQGALARRVAEASVPAGGGLTVAALRDAVPRTAQPLTLRAGFDTVAFLPPPADGGLAAAAAFEALRGGADPAQAQGRALATVAAFRRGGGDPAALLASPPASGTVGPMGASTALVVADRSGNAVSCAFSLNNLFGTGRVLPGLGFLLAAAPRPGGVAAPLLSAVMVSNPNTRDFRYAGAGSGQDDAPMAVAIPAVQHLLRNVPVGSALAAVPEPGRGVAFGCPAGLPGNAASCQAAADPRGGGLAVMGGN